MVVAFSGIVEGTAGWLALADMVFGGCLSYCQNQAPILPKTTKAANLGVGVL